ncbi:MAG: energy-coupling factor transporter transmembrane protein EcfT [Oscillospiraceae bacterium]|nr:energy-coupling factor transporter transmembrane protein EcfT [Oscillospiraceae bacterium]
MLKDITLGQYFPGKTAIHRMDPRIKISLVFLYIIILFIADGLYAYLLLFVWLCAAIAVSRIKPAIILRGIKPIIFVIALTGVLNMFYTPGTPVFELFGGRISVTYEGLETAVYMIVRIVMLITGTFLLTYTTSPLMLTDGIELLLGPLKKLRVPVHELAMMMTIALRFIPTLIEETDKIMSAQKARGADFETGSLFSRAKALIPLLVPLFISAFRRADELAVAMECRCYRGGEGRTRLRSLKYSMVDLYSSLISAAVFGGVIVFRIFGIV